MEQQVEGQQGMEELDVEQQVEDQQGVDFSDFSVIRIFVLCLIFLISYLLSFYNFTMKILNKRFYLHNVNTKFPCKRLLSILEQNLTKVFVNFRFLSKT